jgi:putative DNA primase/helicase
MHDNARLDALVNPPGEPMPNARRFLEAEFHHAERPLLLRQGGIFYMWDGTCWPELDDQDLRARLYEHFEHAIYLHETKGGVEEKPFAPTVRKVLDLLDALGAVAHIPTATPAPTWFNENTMMSMDIVSCINGLVHVPTRTLHPHTPNFYAHHSVAFEFDPEPGEPVRWLEFLDEVWGEDQESIATLQELFGYLLSGDTSQQKMFLLIGPKRSGKGTIARVLRAMLGDHNVAGPTLSGIATNFGLSPLIGKPVAIIADARLKAADTGVVTERLLSISGEDSLTIDRKYRDPWTGQIPSRILILSNELPRLNDSSGAMASRFIVLAMTRSFYGQENPALTQELTAELPAIFDWALDGLERLRDRGRFLQPRSSQEAIRELEDLGSPIGAFVRDECEVGPEMEAIAEDLYGAWKSWCEEHGRRVSNSATFGRDLRAAFPFIRGTQRRIQGKRPRIYTGIRVSRGVTRDTAMNYPREDDRRHAVSRAHNLPNGSGAPYHSETECQQYSGASRVTLRDGPSIDYLIDAARQGTGYDHQRARELLSHDLDELAAGRLTVAAAKHYLEHVEP